jgi:hypothetical protein
LPTSA